MRRNVLVVVHKNWQTVWNITVAVMNEPVGVTLGQSNIRTRDYT